MAKQYKTLAEVKAAYDSGELSRDTSHLILDNDCTPLYLWADEDSDDCDMEDVCVFDGGSPESLLGQALTLLGIPWESA